MFFKYFKKKLPKLHGRLLIVRRTTEPRDIHYKNLHFKTSIIRRRKLIVTFLTIIITLIGVGVLTIVW
jgi:hypothetical protein